MRSSRDDLGVVLMGGRLACAEWLAGLCWMEQTNADEEAAAPLLLTPILGIQMLLALSEGAAQPKWEESSAC